MNGYLVRAGVDSRFFEHNGTLADVLNRVKELKGKTGDKVAIFKGGRWDLFCYREAYNKGTCPIYQQLPRISNVLIQQACKVAP